MPAPALTLTLALTFTTSFATQPASACGPTAVASCDVAQNEHVLARIGYGGDPWSRARIEQIGAFFYVREQLFPELIADPDFTTALVPYVDGPVATWGKTIAELRPQFCGVNADYCTDRRAGLFHVNWQIGEVKFLRAALSRRQLEAVLLDFWLNHFNVDGNGGYARLTMQSYEQDAIAPHALGRFEDLLTSVALAPAMLDYLDLRRSRRGRLNENFARELLELHTVGKEDTYDEDDVAAATNILTGFTNASPDYVTTYNPQRHVQGTKVITLENTEPWVFDGSLGCDGRPADDFPTEAHVLFCLLSLHPKTAEFVSRKLITRFISESVPQDVLERATSAWAASGGNLRGVMLAILSSKQFLLVEEFRGNKFARPQVFTARLTRALGIDALGTSRIVNQPATVNRVRASLNGVMGDQQLMGETMYKAAPPTGYPEAEVAWASAGGMLIRLNQVANLVDRINDPAQRFGITANASADELTDTLIARFLPQGVPAATRARVITSLGELPADADLDDQTRHAAVLLLSSPAFAQH